MTPFSSVILLIALLPSSGIAESIPSPSIVSSPDPDLGRIEEDALTVFPWSAEATASIGLLFLPAALADLTGNAVQSGLAVVVTVGTLSEATTLTVGFDARIATANNARFFDAGILVGAQHPVLSSLSVAVAAGPALQYRRLKLAALSSDDSDFTRGGIVGGYMAKASIQATLPMTSLTWVLAPGVGFSGGAPLEVDLVSLGRQKADLNGARWDAHLRLGIRI